MCSYGPSTVLYWCNKSLLIISPTILYCVSYVVSSAEGAFTWCFMWFQEKKWLRNFFMGLELEWSTLNLSCIVPSGMDSLWWYAIVDLFGNIA